MVEYLGHSRPFTSIQKGLDYLNGECAKRRDILFDEFVKDWNRIGKEGLWDQLQSIIDTHLKNINNRPKKLYSLIHRDTDDYRLNK